MKSQGTLLKMETTLTTGVEYRLTLGGTAICMNDYIGKQIYLHYLNEIYCVECGAKTRTSFAQGYCYNCFQNSPNTSPCILKPELCQAHLGISRDMEWAKNHCLTSHYVYLALSSDVKVGVTRTTQMPTRWIDQGASSAIIIAQTPNRYTAGLIEVALKNIFVDKTNWQRMLKNEVLANVNLATEKRRAYDFVDDSLKAFFTDDDSVTHINYPVLAYPKKITSLTFDKQQDVRGRLVGIKGQYLIFENNSVLNIRKHGGYLIGFDA